MKNDMNSFWEGLVKKIKRKCRDWASEVSGYPHFPFFISFLIHAVILLLLTLNFNTVNQPTILPPLRVSLVANTSPDPQNKTARPTVNPQVSVQAEQRRKAREQEKAAEKKRQEALAEKERQRQKQIALQKEKEQKARQEALAREEQARQEERVRQEARREQKRLEQLKRDQEALIQQLAQEQLLRDQEKERIQAQSDDSEVTYYSDLIVFRMSQFWSRPPSATNDMDMLIEVRLSPFGALLGYKIIKGSGDDAFDQSVVQAVRLATPITELEALNRRIFEKSFRRFKFKFKAGDLVR